MMIVLMRIAFATLLILTVVFGLTSFMISVSPHENRHLEQTQIPFVESVGYQRHTRD